MIVGVASAGAQQGKSRQQQPGALRLAGANTVQGSVRQMGHCQALLPPGWTLHPGQDGSTADLAGENGRAHAAWGIRGVNPAMRAYYGDLYGPPEVAVLATVSAATQSQARYTGAAKSVGSFNSRSFQTGQSVGDALYRVYPGPLPGQYILSLYLSWVDRRSAHLLPTAQAVMASISCRTQLRPPRGGGLPGGNRGGSDRGGESGDKGDLEGYNAQTGQQWAHSPTTGEHYLLDYATQWNETGPEGAGYYRQAGNTYEKLDLGW
jgi:hypothetical protein